MRVLVTRPEPMATELESRLEQIGHEALIDPLLTIEPLPITIADAGCFQATIVTSRNALLGMAKDPAILERLATRPLFTTGSATARAARSMGFVQVIAGDGTAASLPGIVRTQLRAADGSLLYLAGEVKTLDLAASLAPDGYAVETVVVYRSHPAESLRPASLLALSKNQIDVVLLLSARTAATYAALIARHELRDRVEGVLHLCLSPAVAAALAALQVERIVTAPHPNVEELLALIGHPDASVP